VKRLSLLFIATLALCSAHAASWASSAPAHACCAGRSKAARPDIADCCPAADPSAAHHDPLASCALGHGLHLVFIAADFPLPASHAFVAVSDAFQADAASRAPPLV
jgi:hypothetical protein